tara:strand:- start:1007 stop:2218 length:1212 start_codon:yes stop_codon:yes gene_type:complete
VRLLIHKETLGTIQHLMTDPDTRSVQWRSDIPDDVWVLGDKSHPMSIQSLLEVLGEEPICMFPASHKKAFEELVPDGLAQPVPWRWVLGDKKFMDLLNDALERSRINVCALEQSKYEQTYRLIRRFLLSLQEPLVNIDKLAYYIKNNKKGMTVEASLRSFVSKTNKAPKITYDQAGTATGRLTVKKGPRILTLPSKYRDILKPSDGCEVVQIDLVSAEPRTALYVAGKEASGDVYSQISNDLNLNVERDVVKVASLSALYGAGSSSLADLLGSRPQARRVISSLRSHFGVQRIESQLMSDLKSNGYITNLFGRKLMTRKDEYQKVYSHFMQSTTSDAAICMFSQACELLKSTDSNFKAFYVIHDALVCEISKDLRPQLEKLTQKLSLGGVGLYETKMTSVSDN